jgi:hypothetical protein
MKTRIHIGRSSLWKIHVYLCLKHPTWHICILGYHDTIRPHDHRNILDNMFRTIGLRLLRSFVDKSDLTRKVSRMKNGALLHHRPSPLPHQSRISLGAIVIRRRTRLPYLSLSQRHGTIHVLFPAAA